MAIDPTDYRNNIKRRLTPLPIRHRAAFAALCAERQFGTYIYTARQDSSLQPRVLRRAIDRCWEFVSGEEVSHSELESMKVAVDQLIPDLNEDMSGFASLILDAVAAVSYLLNTCLTGSIEDATAAGECARNAVDEWVIGIVAPCSEDLSGDIISVAPQEVLELQAKVDAHPMMLREMLQQEHDLTYLESHRILDANNCDYLRSAWPNCKKSNLDLE